LERIAIELRGKDGWRIDEMIRRQEKLPISIVEGTWMTADD
jgi:hypothetical protein